MNNYNPTNMIYQMLSRGMNPQAILQQMMSQNPKSQFIFNQVQQSGLSLRDYTLQYAKQNRIDINPLIQMMSQFGIKL